MNIGKRVVNRIKRIFTPPPYRERIVVKTVGSVDRNPSPPCFLIGVYRSGTTLLRFVLDSHSNIAVPPETNFLYELAQMWHSEWVKKGLAGAGVDKECMKSLLKTFASGVLDNYASAKEKGRWIDKTPAYTDILDFLDYLYSEDCKYIMLYRHGLDVADSLAGIYEKNVLGGPAKIYADKMNGSPKAIFARYWAEQCEKMLAFEDAHANQCHRIYYEQYASDPEKHLPPLFEFLGEAWEPDVLKYNEKQHDFGLQDSHIESTSTFSPRSGAYKNWSKEDLTEAMHFASKTIKTLGYKVGG
jgi:hypothetical protein